MIQNVRILNDLHGHDHSIHVRSLVMCSYVFGRDVTQFKTPGPGAYSPEHVGANAYFHHPKYSFGIRHRHRTSDNTPCKS